MGALYCFIYHLGQCFLQYFFIVISLTQPDIAVNISKGFITARHVRVRLSVRHRPVLYRNDRIWQEGFFSPIPHCVIREFGYLQKLRYFPLELRSKLRTRKFRLGESIALSVTRRRRRCRRRRSSLLTTPIRQSTSRGCFLQVGEL